MRRNMGLMAHPCTVYASSHLATKFLDERSNLQLAGFAIVAEVQEAASQRLLANTQTWSEPASGHTCTRTEGARIGSARVGQFICPDPLATQSVNSEAACAVPVHKHHKVWSGLPRTRRPRMPHPAAGSPAGRRRPVSRASPSVQLLSGPCQRWVCPRLPPRRQLQ